jgi:ATP-dependent protease ClpP protease subunit
MNHPPEPPKQGAITIPISDSSSYQLVLDPEIKVTALKDLLIREPVSIEVNEFDHQSARDFELGVAQAIKAKQQFLVVTIDSYGGDVYACFRMVDAVRKAQELGLEVITVAKSKAMSAGALLLSSGSVRFVNQDAQVMIHHVSSGAWGKTPDLFNDATHVKYLDTRMLEILDSSCEQVPGYWAARIHDNKHSDLYLTAAQCLEARLGTHIGDPSLTFEVSISVMLENE